MIRVDIKKIQYDINKETGKVSVLSSGKIDKYEYLTGEEILLSDQSKIIEQGKFTHSPLEKAFEKLIKQLKVGVEEHIKALEEHRKQLVESNSKKTYD